MTEQDHQHANAAKPKVRGERHSRARRTMLRGGVVFAVIVGLAATSSVASAATPGESATVAHQEAVAQSAQAPHQGFRVRHGYVPNGYVLQGASIGSLDITERGNHTPLTNFRHKLVVTLEGSKNTAGTPVRVGHHPGRYRAAKSGDAVLTYSDGRHHVNILKSRNIHLTKSQLIHFAEGVVVTKYADVSHGG